MNKLYFISDAHIDHLPGNQKHNYTKFLNLFKKGETYFIPGDTWDDLDKTISFIKDLEKKQIKGFYCLGNHEFHELRYAKRVLPEASWNKFLERAKAATKNNKFMKLMYTGREEKWKDYTVIGDTAWTNFLNSKRNKIDVKKFQKELPDLAKKGNWNWCIKQNKAFEKFANQVLAKKDKVIIMTHHPLYPVNLEVMHESDRLREKVIKGGKKIKDLGVVFYYSNNKINIKEGQTVYFIHGHTHAPSYKIGHYTNGIGREGKEVKMQELIVK